MAIVAEDFSFIHGKKIGIEPVNLYTPGKYCFRHILFFLLKIFLLILLLWFVGKSLYSAIDQVDWTTISVKPFFLLKGFLIITMSFITGAWGLKYIYQNFDSIRLSLPQAFVLLSLPPLGKYLPSKFFAFAGQAVIAKSYGIRVLISGAVTFLTMGFGLASATLIGVTLLMFNPPVESFGIIFKWAVWGTLVGTSIIIFFPDFYWRLMDLALSLMRQSPVQVNMDRKTMAVLFIALLLQNGLYLLGISVITAGLVSLPVSTLFTLVGVTCIANVAGFIVLFAPAGIGVREGILLVLLTPVCGPGTAGLIAVVMRVVQTFSDCIFGLAGFTIFHLLKKGVWNK